MERLSDPEDVIGYLEVSLEEYLDDGDKAFFLKGIKNVIEAQGGILSVSDGAAHLYPRPFFSVTPLGKLVEKYSDIAKFNMKLTEIFQTLVRFKSQTQLGEK